MTTREKGYVYYAECCESLNRALRILRDLRGVDAAAAVHEAAFHFAVVEYAKPYSALGDARRRNRRAYKLAAPELPPDDLALHRRIIALRDQLLAHQELALKDAMELPDGHRRQASVDITKNGAPPLINVDAMIGLIERTLVIMTEERSRLLASLTASQARTRLVAKAVKVAIQGTGMLAGVFGIGMLAMMGLGAYHAIAERDPAAALFSVLFLGMGSYFLYVAYLVTCEYSPLAVRHICGALAFIAVSHFARPFLHPHTDLQRLSPWTDLTYFAALIALYYGYRAASNRLNGFLFPGAQPTKIIPRLRESKGIS